MPGTAITTICIGDTYRLAWQKYCRPNWENYAQRHGFDLVLFDAPLDTSEQAAGRSVAWQKCLVLEALKKYERVVWIDSDILIHRDAPSIVEGVPLGKVGAVISGSYIHPDLRAVFLTRYRGIPRELAMLPEAWDQDQARWYDRLGIPCKSPEIVQTGVLVLDQSHHDLMRGIYDSYPAELPSYEQFPLSAAIINNDLLHRLNSRFNVVFNDLAMVHYPYLFNERFNSPDLKRLAIRSELENSFFLHFALRKEWMPFATE